MLFRSMELMERSLADVLVLVEEGLVLEEKAIARFSGDVRCSEFVDTDNNQSLIWLS